MAETKKARHGENGKGGADPSAAGSPAAGPAVIRDYLKTLPGSPGVYRMIGAGGGVLYVGKAKDLKRRVASYTRPSRLSNRLRRMVSETAAMEVVTTHTEVEALLLESNLIKELKPRYNVLLRDDKSFPHIFIGGDHEWPQLAKHRGARSRKGDYFGPFASAGAVNETIAILERAFLLRTCSDAVFSSRGRPCLLYQIRRCAAPCVGRVAPEDYAALASEAKEFLRGRSQAIQKQLARRMQEASDALAYEQAAVYRDRIQALTQVQTRQDINVQALGEADVIAAHQAGGQTCIQVFFFRAGRNHGNRAYFPRHDRQTEAAEVVGAFLGQFYDSRTAPGIVLISHPVAERRLIEEALSLGAGRRVRVSTPRRGVKRKLIDHALANAREALARRLSESASQRKLLEEVANIFALDAAPGRIEVFDNSHIQGTKAVGAMIVAGVEGPDKNAYRKFNIRSTATPDSPAGISPGDDYGMMREVLTRRFTRALKEDPGREKGSWPDLVLIDGGAGHLSTAREALADLGIEDVPVAAIAKGTDRNAGRERFFLSGREPFTLDPRDPVLYYLQRLRDEAHRFAIGGHRRKRSAAIGRSMLDEIEGIGGARKRALLHHFGSARGVARAGLADLETVSGISKAVAKKIYGHFHDNG